MHLLPGMMLTDIFSGLHHQEDGDRWQQHQSVSGRSVCVPVLMSPLNHRGFSLFVGILSKFWWLPTRSLSQQNWLRSVGIFHSMSLM